MDLFVACFSSLSLPNHRRHVHDAVSPWRPHLHPTGPSVKRFFGILCCVASPWHRCRLFEYWFLSLITTTKIGLRCCRCFSQRRFISS